MGRRGRPVVIVESRFVAESHVERVLRVAVRLVRHLRRGPDGAACRAGLGRVAVKVGIDGHVVVAVLQRRSIAVHRVSIASRQLSQIQRHPTGHVRVIVLAAATARGGVVRIPTFGNCCQSFWHNTYIIDLTDPKASTPVAGRRRPIASGGQQLAARTNKFPTK